MKPFDRLDIILLIIVMIVSGIIHYILDGHLSNGYIAIIIFCFGMSIMFVKNLVQSNKRS